MRWGLVPRWAKDLKVGYKMINAKAENLTASRAYGPLVGKFRHRCLIVADGFYEWMKAEDPKQPRQPWRFTVDGGEPFAFAGLCTRKEWEDAGGPRLRRRLALQLHDRDDDPERGRRPGPQPDAGDPAEPRGRGRLAATRTSAPRTRWRCAGRSTRARMEGAPANPKLNKVGKGMEEGPELLVAPRRADASPPPTLPLRLLRVLLLSSSASSSIGGGRSAARRRCAPSPRRRWSRACRRSRPPARGRAPDDVEGQLQVLLSACRRQEVFDPLVADLVVGHSTLTPAFGGEARVETSSNSSTARSAAVRAEVDQHGFRHVLVVDARLRWSAGRWRAGRRASGRLRCRAAP